MKQGVGSNRIKGSLASPSIKREFRGRNKDKQLALEVGARIFKAMRDRSYYEISKMAKDNGADISPNTIWGYVKGLNIPGPERLIVLSKVLDKSIDWLLKGEETPRAKDNREIMILNGMRKADSLNIDLGILQDFLDMLIAKKA